MKVKKQNWYKIHCSVSGLLFRAISIQVQIQEEDEEVKPKNICCA